MVHPNNLNSLLKNLQPILFNETYVFVSCPNRNVKLAEICFCMVTETEGITYILTRDQALEFSLKYSFEASRISLGVHSSLEAVGLIAKIAQTLAKAGISCNVVAGYYHDHLFVPVHKGQEAMDLLEAISE